VKKRTASGDIATSPPKKTKLNLESKATPFQIESSLALPISADTEEILKTVVLCNRAPLVLAFAVTVMKYTMPEQPLSSRLSLAQAVVSANSRTKAMSLGIETGPSAEDEGWGQGQPTVKVLGREIRVLKRWGYTWKEEGSTDNLPHSLDKETLGHEKMADVNLDESDNMPALWGLDTEALRRLNGPAVAELQGGRNSSLPIFRAESARDYLLKSFRLKKLSEASLNETARIQKLSNSATNKEKCLGLLLGAIDLLCRSWVSTLSREELDRRAWSWYVHVRPEVETGVSGWGQKGLVHLSEIIALRKQT
jgi:hypothetical protein